MILFAVRKQKPMTIAIEQKNSFWKTTEVALAHIEDQLSSVAVVASISTMILLQNTFTVQPRAFINHAPLKL